jgi:hypothetical protein
MLSAGCREKQEQRPRADQQLPTATEVFRLRSACAEYGERILQENVIGRNLAQDVVSHYDPKSNRCYVELTVQDAALEGTYLAMYLYDGQTKEQLAFAMKKNGKEFGTVFHGPQRTYEEVTDYVGTMMEDKDHLVKPAGIAK